MDLAACRKPDIAVDIRKWDYEAAYPPGYFDLIWASPECKEYSRAKTVGYRDLAYADSCVLAAIQIIGYFQPAYWFIENPQTGLLKDRPFMRGLPYHDVTYCMYGRQYQKPTRIWTNHADFKPRFCCRYRGTSCKHRDASGKHLMAMAGDGRLQKQEHSMVTKYSIPESLLKSLFSECI